MSSDRVSTRLVTLEIRIQRRHNVKMTIFLTFQVSGDKVAAVGRHLNMARDHIRKGNQKTSPLRMNKLRIKEGSVTPGMKFKTLFLRRS